MGKNSGFEKTYELLGENENFKAFRLRTLIVDTIANIENTDYLSDILHLAGSALCKQEYRDKNKKTRANKTGQS